MSQRNLSRILPWILMLSIIVSPLRPAQKAEAQGQAPNSTSTVTPTATPTTIPEMAVTPPGEAPTATPEGAPEREVTETQDFVTSAELIPAESWRAPEDITWVMFRSETDATSLHDWRRTQGGAQSGEWKYTHSDLGTPRNHTMYEWTWAVDSIPPDAQVHLVFFVTSNDSGSVPPVEEMDLLRMYFRRLRDGLREPVTIVAAHVVAGSWFAIDLDRTADWVVLNKEKFGLDVVADVRGQVASEFSLDSWGVYYVAPAGSTPTPTATPTRTPTPTWTPSATPSPTPTAADTTMNLATPVAFALTDDQRVVCKEQNIPGTGVARGLPRVAAPESVVRPSVRMMPPCAEPRHVARVIPPQWCFNPQRVYVGKDVFAGSDGWVAEYRCPDQSTGGPMILGTLNAEAGVGPTGPIVGLTALALTAYTAVTQPKAVTMFFESAGSQIGEGGKVFADSWLEAKNWALSLAYHPATQDVTGTPNGNVQLFDGDGIAATTWFYRPLTPPLWEVPVWTYPGLDAPEKVATVQQLESGPHGTTLKSYTLSTRPNGAEWSSLWDGVAAVLAEGYDIPDALPGVRERNGKHSSDESVLGTAKKNCSWITCLNWAKGWTDAHRLPPWSWCGYREEDAACACVNYYLEITRAIINGAGVAATKTARGIGVIINSNSTAVTDLAPRVYGCQQWTEGCKPRTPQWDRFETIGPGDDRCPPDFGLTLARYPGDNPWDLVPQEEVMSHE